MHKQLRLFCVALLFTGSIQTAAEPSLPIDPALDAALLYDGNGEGVNLKGILKQDFDPGMPGDEYVVVWTMIGPTYWSTFISVVSDHAGKWTSLARLNLGGVDAELGAVRKDGLIILNANVPGPDDPVCCPSQHKKTGYRYNPEATGGKRKLLEVNPDAAGKP